MKTFSPNLEPVVYQYRFEHSTNAIGHPREMKSPHFNNVRKVLRRRKFDPTNFKKVLYTKLLIIGTLLLSFSILSLVF